MNIIKKFTLIELLVVVAIIGILLTLLLPSLSNARKAGKTAVSISNLKQIYAGTLLYADTYSGYLFKTSSNNGEINWSRLMFENMTGKEFSSRPNDCIQEMTESQSYTNLMFCPVIRDIRGRCTQHGQGRSDYSMNKHFSPEHRNISQLTEGKEEPFMSPGTAMPSTQAGPALRNGTYSPNTIGHPSYVYIRQKTLGLYIDGHVSSYTVSRGAEIDSMISDRNDFE